jgi:phage terminase small subunit
MTDQEKKERQVRSLERKVKEIGEDFLEKDFDSDEVAKDLSEIEAGYDVDRFNLREETFINEYFINGGDHVAAYIKAGYSAWSASAGSRLLLENPKIKAEISRRREHMRKKYEISHDHVLQEYAKMSFANIKDYFGRDEEDNITILDVDKIPEHAASAISSVELGDDGKIKKFKLNDKGKSLDSLSKNLGLFENSDKMMLEMGLSKFLKLLPEEDRDRLKTAMLAKMEQKLLK